jgi:hypothetical protein
MDDMIARLLENFHGRVGGPMSLRLVLQPAIAALFAVRAGLQDGRAGRPAYFWAVLTDAAQRRELLREGWKAVAKIFAMAVAIDAIYQWIELRWFYPGEALIVAFLLACVPYLLIRGPVGQIAGFGKGRAF